MIKVTITHDPHNPGSRVETHANLDGAAASAIRNGWTALLYQPRKPHYGHHERTVTVVGGVVTSPEPADDVAWWTRRAQR